MFKKNKKTILLFLTALLLVALVSCDPTKKYENEESAIIKDYLSKNPDLNFQLQPSGLYFLDVVPGTGISPVLYDSAFVKYTGKFLNGSVFDTNVGTANVFGFVVGYSIYGFSEGLMLMKEGGKATLLIPSNLAYGQQGSYPIIAGFTPLLFDVELIRVKPAVVK